MVDNPDISPREIPDRKLSFQFVFALLSFLGPFGAEEMNFPHIFWIGLLCWIIALGILIRVIWILLSRSNRLSRQIKILIIFIAIILVCVIAYKPAVRAIRRHADKANAPTKVPLVHKQIPTSAPDIRNVPDSKRPKTRRRPKTNSPQSTPTQPTRPRPVTPTQNCPNGVCIGGNNFGNATVNNYLPPPPKISWNQTALQPLSNANVPGTPPEPSKPEVEVLIELRGVFLNPAFTFRCSVPCLLVNQLTLSDDGDNASNFGTSVRLYNHSVDHTAFLLVYNSPSRMLAATRLEITFRSLDERAVKILDVQPYIPPE